MGQIITISGKGFSEYGSNEVKLGDTSCKILSQTKTKIVCRLQQRSPSDTFAVQGWHSGLRWDFFQRTSSISSISNVKAIPSTAGNTVSSVLTGETPMYYGDDYISRLKGFFRAPTTGTYTFIASGDDEFQVDISLIADSSDRANLVNIISKNGATKYREFRDDAQYGNATLTAGSLYYMEAYHRESWGSDFFTLGVIIPGMSQTVNPLPEIQRVTINCPLRYDIYEFSIPKDTSNVGKWQMIFSWINELKEVVQTRGPTGISASSTQVQVQ